MFARSKHAIAARLPLLVTALAVASCGKPSPPLTVRVVDGTSGAPIAGAQVIWAFAHPDSTTGQMVRTHDQTDSTGADGSCAFESMPEELRGSMQRFLIDASAPGFSYCTHVDSATFEGKRGVSIELGILPDKGEALIEGAVHDAVTRKPLAGVAVTALATLVPGGVAESTGDPRFEPRKGYTTTSDASGRFSIRADYFALDRSSYFLHVLGTLPEYRYAELDFGAHREVERGVIRANYARAECELYLAPEKRLVTLEAKVSAPRGVKIEGQELVVATVQYVGTCDRGCHGGQPMTRELIPLTVGKGGEFRLEVSAAYAYALNAGVRVGKETELLFWRNPIPVGGKEGKFEFVFTDGTRVQMSAKLKS